MYGPPGGCFLLGFLGDDLAGGVGLRDLGDGICEMKRLYVYDVARGGGVALALCADLIIASDDARFGTLYSRLRYKRT